MSELIRRRVPQLVGAYLLAGWGVLQFAQFLESRYQLTRHMVELVGVAWLLLLPSVAIVAYGHGAAGADRWRRFEKLVVGGNLLLAAGLLFLVFSGKSFGSVVRPISIVDEDGKATQRLIPRGELLRRIALFPFDGAETDSTRWLADAAATALFYDLLQDQAMAVVDASGQTARLERLGHADGHGMSDATRRRFASELHAPWWIDGAVRRSGNTFELTLRLHHVDAAELVAEQVATGGFFEAVDQLSHALRQPLGVPRSYVEKFDDKAVTEIFCSDLEALRAYVTAVRLSSLDKDYDAAMVQLDSALGVDPAFTTANFLAFVTKSSNSDLVGATPYLQRAMDHLYRVPERFAFQIKMAYFMNVQPDGERAMKVGALWAKLYPQDLAVHQTLAGLHMYRDEKPQAIAELRRVLELDPSEKSALRTIASLLAAQGDYAGAEQALSDYAQAYPDERAPHSDLAGLYLRKGKLGEARAEYEQALLIEPGHVATQVALAALDARAGEFAGAERQFASILQQARLDRDRMTVLQAMEGFDRERGKLVRAAQRRQEHYAAAASVLSPTELVLTQLLDFDTAREAGDLDRIEAEIDRLGSELTGLLSAFVSAARAHLAALRGDAATTQSLLVELEQLIDSTGLRALDALVAKIELTLAEQLGDDEGALQRLDAVQQAEGESTRTLTIRGRLLARLGRDDEALAALDRAIALQPFAGEANLEKALLHERRGEFTAAREHLDRCLRLWSEADAGYARRERARALEVALLTTP